MSAPTSEDAHSTQLTGDALKEALKKQVEFYFSRANLANDAFLVSHMNSQMYVPVEVIINFAKIKQLTDDTKLLVESIRESTICSLNETNDAIKPNIKSERNTIILREIPSATKPEEVKAIFDGCGTVVNVRSDVGDTWFVTMESEDDAVNTLLALRSKTFNNAPIKARLKSENLLKSFYPTKPAAPENAAVAMATPYGPRGYYNMPQMGYYDANSYGAPYNAQQNARGSHGGDGHGRYGMNHRGGRGGRHGHGGRGGHASGPASMQQAHVGKDGRNKATPEQRPNGKKGKDKRGAQKQDKQAPAPNSAKKAHSPSERQPILNAANFPPLPTAPEDKESTALVTITHKYSHEDIMEIVKNMDENDCKLAPGKMDFEAHSAALTPDAHPDLLRNQRTYSIEQAREAMRQGRPIRSDSIGSIDYESMMYGEDYTKEAREQRKKEADTEKVSSESKTAPPPVNTSSKFSGYAAAVINGQPASPALVEAVATKKKQPKPKTPKDKDEKKKVKSPSKNGAAQESSETAKPTDDLPKAGAWGGRNFLDVVKSEPTAQAPAPKAATPPAPAKVSASEAKKSNDTPKEKRKEDK